MKIGGLAGKRSAAEETAAQIREPAHETRRPKSKVGDRHPDVVDACLLQHREQQAEDYIVRIVVRERLLQNLGEKGEGSGPRIIDRFGQWRVEDFKGVEPHQLLAGLLSVVGADVGHGLERAAETTARSCR